MGAPLCFLDTETTGLALDDDIWEIAAIRREPDGSEETLHLFVEHSYARCHNLPKAFRADHAQRWPEEESTSRHAAARAVLEFTRGAHIVGAVPNFDTERLARLCLGHLGEGEGKPAWHYHLIDVEALTVGYLSGRCSLMMHCPPPWKSDDLSRAIGVDPDKFARHTAMGDVQWAMAIYDKVMG